MLVITDNQGNTYDLHVRPRLGNDIPFAERKVKDILDSAPKKMFRAPTSIEPQSGTVPGEKA